MQPSGHTNVERLFFNLMGEEKANVSGRVLRLGLGVCFTRQQILETCAKEMSEEDAFGLPNAVGEASLTVWCPMPSPCPS